MTDTLNTNTIIHTTFSDDNMISSIDGAVGSTYATGVGYYQDDYDPYEGIDFSVGISDLKLDYHNRETDDLLGIRYKYDENLALAKIRDYINSTYGQHYVGNGDIQTVDFWESLGSLETTCRDTAIKYLARYGKKGGRNQKDLLKAVHYIILMMYAAPKENEVPKEFKV